VTSRRQVLQQLAMGGAAAATLPSWVEALSAFAVEQAPHAHAQRAGAKASAWKPEVFTPHQNETVIAISEIIIPQTDTPGAKAAKVNEFIDYVLARAPQRDRDRFVAGLQWIDDRTQREHGRAFAASTPEQQLALLTQLSNANDAATAKSGTPGGSTSATATSATGATAAADAAGIEFFQAIKSMTITGYYTSEVGVRQELGDDGMLFFTEFKGCTHPEHQR
jgi:glucoside 3-dehydrogenase (cytochrome c) hitch-hiker subunit